MSKKGPGLEVVTDIAGQVGAIVLGGGRGMRLHPLTALRCKPAVPLLGRYRLVDIPLSQCIHSGINRIVLLTQFNSASLHRHIQNSYKFDHFSKGFVEILAAEQTTESGDWFQGTADAVRKHLRHLRDLRAKYYLVLSGDQLYRMDYRSLIQSHIERGADITVSAIAVTERAARGFGIMRVSGNGRIREFVEKPSDPEALRRFATTDPIFTAQNADQEKRPYLASMGVYVFRAEVMEEILETRPEWIDFGKHIIPLSLRQRNVFAYPFSGFWEDIGTVRSYYEVHMQMAGPNPPLELFTPRNVIYTHPRYLPGARFEDVRIQNSIICEGCRIQRAEIVNSVVGIRSVIGKNTTIRRSIIMGADFLVPESEEGRETSPGIGPGSHIENAIVDKNARIGSRVFIRGSRKLPDMENHHFAVRDGIVCVLKNAVIPHGTRIE